MEKTDNFSLKSIKLKTLLNGFLLTIILGGSFLVIAELFFSSIDFYLLLFMMTSISILVVAYIDQSHYTVHFQITNSGLNIKEKNKEFFLSKDDIIDFDSYNLLSFKLGYFIRLTSNNDNFYYYLTGQNNIGWNEDDKNYVNSLSLKLDSLLKRKKRLIDYIVLCFSFLPFFLPILVIVGILLALIML